MVSFDFGSSGQVPRTLGLYGSANDPRTANDLHIGLQMIPMHLFAILSRIMISATYASLPWMPEVFSFASGEERQRV